MDFIRLLFIPTILGLQPPRDEFIFHPIFKHIIRGPEPEGSPKFKVEMVCSICIHCRKYSPRSKGPRGTGLRGTRLRHIGVNLKAKAAMSTGSPLPRGWSLGIPGDSAYLMDVSRFLRTHGDRTLLGPSLGYFRSIDESDIVSTVNERKYRSAKNDVRAPVSYRN